MFKSRNTEERNQEIREAFAHRWENSSQHEKDEKFFLTAPFQAKMKINLEEDPLRLVVEIRLAGWVFEKQLVDQVEILELLNQIVVN